MRLKAEFRRRLLRLYFCLDNVLASDNLGSVKEGNLFPRLFSVLSYIWSHKTESVFKD